MVVADFEEDVDVFGVFEEMVKLTNVLVLQRTMNFDLRHKFLLSS